MDELLISGGGGGGNWGFPTYTGGGGGSYNSGENQDNISGVNEGHGYVVITFDNDLGCMDPYACNYDPEALEDDGSCAEVDDCGVCDGGNADMDCAGVCDGTAVVDCASECDVDDFSCAYCCVVLNGAGDTCVG